jgi:hypothetical protein
MSLIYNERIKYFATALNGVAVGCITAGVIAPIIAVAVVPGASDRTSIILLLSIIWLLLAMFLHAMVQAILGRLKE